VTFFISKSQDICNHFEIFQCVQLWAPQHRKDIIRLLENLPHAGSLRELDLSSLGKRYLQRPYQQSPVHLRNGSQEDGARLFTEACRLEDERQGLKLKCERR